MNAAIDIGNSQVKVGLFEKDALLTSETLSIDQVNDYLIEKRPEELIISNVSGPTALVSEILALYPNAILLSSTTPLPIEIDYETPNTLGMDRLAAAVGAAQQFDGNLAILDAGSCITLDVVDQNKVFRGGVISPGLNMRLKAMHNFTKSLPLLNLSDPKEIIGRSTEQAMLSGSVNGARAEVVGNLQKYQNDYPDLKVIICGGDRFFFDKMIEFRTFVLSNLVLEGLNAILRFNDRY